MKIVITLLLGAVLSAATVFGLSSPDENAESPTPANAANSELAYAVFAGGCFWCVEADFDKVEGVVETVSGYTGGALENPTYRDVLTETTGHYEAVKIGYNPEVVDYRTLVDYLLRHVDPLDDGGQFCDRGPSYRTAVFVATDEERQAAEAAIDEAAGALDATLATPVVDQGAFWPAETYHQDYYLKNPIQYRYYRTACGRDRRIRAVWGSVDQAKAS